MTKGDMVAAIEAVFFPFQPLDKLSQRFGILVLFFLLFSHGVLHKKAP